MNKENNSSRGNFLKNLSIAAVSIFGIGLTGLSFQKFQQFLQGNSKSISVSEANKLIAEMKHSGTNKIKPEPAPQIDRLHSNEI